MRKITQFVLALLVALVMVFSVSGYDVQVPAVSVPGMPVVEVSANATAVPVPTLYTGEGAQETEGNEVTTTEDSESNPPEPTLISEPAKTNVAVSPKGVKVGDMVEVTPGIVSVKTPRGAVVVKSTADMKTMLEQNDNFDFNDLDQVASKVEVRAGKIVAGGVEVNYEGKTMTVQTPSGNTIQITPGQGAVVIKDKNMEISAEGLTVEGNKVKMNDKEIMMPSEIFDAELEADIKDLELMLEEDMPIYTGQKEQNKKLFFFMPVTFNETMKFNAETGKELASMKPWWSMFAWG